MRTIKRKGTSMITRMVVGSIVVTIIMVIGLFMISNMQYNLTATSPQANQIINRIWDMTYYVLILVGAFSILFMFVKIKS